MPVWRCAGSSPGAMARAFDGPELALRRLFGKGGPAVMDISIEAGVARVDIRQRRRMRRCPFAPIAYAGNLQNSRSARERQVRSALRSARFSRTALIVAIVAAGRSTRSPGCRPVEALDQRVRFPDRLL